MTEELRPCTGPLTLGTRPEIAPTLAGDPRVVWADTPTSSTPILVPIGYLPWWSEPFFSELVAGGRGQHTWYVDWDFLRDAEGTSVTQVDSSFRGPEALWVSEVPEQLLGEADEAVRRFAATLGLTVTPTPLLGTEEAVEEYYGLELRQRTVRRDRWELARTWSDVVMQGLAAPDDPNGPSLLRAPTARDLDSVWELYEESMSELSRTHPIRAELDRETFETLINSDSGGVLVARVDGAPVSLAVIGSDLEHFSWLDSRWLNERLNPPSPGNLMVFPGIVTRSDSRGEGSIIKLLELLDRILIHCGAEVTIIFPCDNTSREYTPKIAQAACDLGNPEIFGTVEFDLRYIFRGYCTRALGTGG